ncbi:MAG: protein tyrosine phosphatase [Rhizobiales bacterium 32-66-8]|nr:MAG: protein tyrosine phosphatase [Rhizobiales bacterium 32-66-8]
MGPVKLNADDAIKVFDALAQQTRLETYRLLLRYVPYGLPAGDVARLLAVPHNTMSTHLALLERAGLLTARREGRSIIYAANVAPAAPMLASLMGEMGFTVTPRRGGTTTSFPQVRTAAANDRVYNVLLVCSANSARSLIAEAVLNREGWGRFRAFSAGSRPKGKPHPGAISLLQSLGYETDGLVSKSWNGFASDDAAEMDFVITTCDAAAGEQCPAFPGHPLQAHWGLPDPALVKGSEAEQREAFVSTYRRIASRISAFVNLPFSELDLATLKDRIAEIGRMEGATELTLSGVAA